MFVKEIERRLEEVASMEARGVTRRDRINEMKTAVREVITEWLDDKVRQVGRWSLRGISLAAFAALVYFILTHSGWTHK